MELDFLEPDEHVLFSGKANKTVGAGVLGAEGGVLTLTDKRLVFAAHSFNIGKKFFEIPLNQIAVTGNTLNILVPTPNTIRVNLKDGSGHTFVVVGKDKENWKKAIAVAVSQSAQESPVDEEAQTGQNDSNVNQQDFNNNQYNTNQEVRREPEIDRLSLIGIIVSGIGFLISWFTNIAVGIVPVIVGDILVSINYYKHCSELKKNNEARPFFIKYIIDVAQGKVENENKLNGIFAIASWLILIITVFFYFVLL